MPKFEVTVRMRGKCGQDSVEARRAVEEELKSGGVTNWSIVSVEREARVARRAASAKQHRTAVPPRRQPNAGALLLIGAIAWAIWLFWMLL